MVKTNFTQVLLSYERRPDKLPLYDAWFQLAVEAGLATTELSQERLHNGNTAYILSLSTERKQSVQKRDSY